MDYGEFRKREQWSSPQQRYSLTDDAVIGGHRSVIVDETGAKVTAWHEGYYVVAGEEI